MVIKFTAPIDPLPQPRPKFGNGRAYQPKKIIEYKEHLKYFAIKAMAGQMPLEGKIRVRLTFYRKFSPTSRNFGDFDNLAKAVCDALNGIVYADDSQIISCLAEKFTDKELPRVEVSAVNFD